MRLKLTVALAAAGLAVAGATLSTGPATAGHLNKVLQATLDGRQEVVTGAKDNRIAGDPDGRGEAYVFGIDGSSTTLCYVLTVERIAELDEAPKPMVRMAHIHKGRAGQNGPVVANLAWPQGGEAGDCLTAESGRFVNGGSAQAILADPEGFYVNVHNGEFPGGALRGQLAEQD